MAFPKDIHLICKVCGGTFFCSTHAEQFSLGGFGTAEFRSLSGSPKTLLICAGCGTPVVAKPSYYARGTTAATAEEDFRKSIELGQKHRVANSINNVANIAASPAEVQELRDQVDELRKALLALAKPPVVIDKAEPKPAIKVKKARVEAVKVG